MEQEPEMRRSGYTRDERRLFFFVQSSLRRMNIWLFKPFPGIKYSNLAWNKKYELWWSSCLFKVTLHFVAICSTHMEKVNNSHFHRQNRYHW